MFILTTVDKSFVKARDDMYVDDLVNEGECINEFKKLKSDSIILFRQGGLSGILKRQY